VSDRATRRREQTIIRSSRDAVVTWFAGRRAAVHGDAHCARRARSQQGSWWERGCGSTRCAARARCPHCRSRCVAVVGIGGASIFG